MMELLQECWPVLLVFGLLFGVLVFWRGRDEAGTMAPNWGNSGCWIILILVVIVAAPTIYAVLTTPEHWGTNAVDDTGWIHSLLQNFRGR